MSSRHSLKSLLQTLRQVFYILGYGVCRAVVRPRGDLVLFLSDSAAEPAGNARAVIDELATRGYRVETVMRPGLRVRKSLRTHVRLCILMAQAKVIMVDDFYPMIYQIRLRPGTQLLQLWHASGAFKSMGFSRSGKPGGPIRGSKTHKNYTAAICSSKDVRGNYAEAFGIPVDKVHATGIPRTDPFFDSQLVADTTARVRAELGIAEGKELLLFAPTFRGNGQLTAHYDSAAIDWEDLANRFGDKYAIGVRMHPFVRDLPAIVAADSRFLDLSTYPDANALLMATDLLVTDYSSIIFDYALLGRPVVFFCPDLAQYTAARDFYYPFARYTYGPVAKDYAELADAITTATVDTTALAEFNRFFVGACDGQSTARVVDQLIAPFLDFPSDDASGQSAMAAPAPSLKTRIAVLGARAVRAALTVVYAPMKLLPARNQVTLISRQGDTPSVDFELLAAQFERDLPGWTIKTLCYEFHSSTKKKLGYIPHVLTQMRNIAVSRVVVIDTYCIPVSALNHKKSLRVIQTWHAMGAIKKFGYSILDRGEGSSSLIAQAMAMHRNYDVALASAPAAVPYFAEAFNASPTIMRVAPLPRTDLLTDPAHLTAKRAELLARYPHLATGKNILFAPTFHKGQSFDAAELTQFFAARGFNFIAKAHPVALSADAPDQYAQASAFDLLAVADFVVTDYSSIMIEAAIVDIPVFVLAPDLAGYRKKRSFYVDFEAEVPSPIATTFSELSANIAAFDGDKTALRAFANRWVQLPVGQSCTEQIVRLALGESAHR